MTSGKKKIGLISQPLNFLKGTEQLLGNFVRCCIKHRRIKWRSNVTMEFLARVAVNPDTPRTWRNGRKRG